MSARSGRTASHWGSYLLSARDGEIVDVNPVPEDQDPSRIGENYRGMLRHGMRITSPAIRRGWLEGRREGRGAEEFVEVSWDEAVGYISSELERVRTDFGNEAIFGGSYGWGSAGRFHHAQSQVHRFLNSIGGYTRSFNTYSHAADEVILPHLVGDRDWFLRSVPSWDEIANNTEELIAFGGLPQRSAQINPGGVGSHVNVIGQVQAARNGVNFTVISPIHSDTTATVDADWIGARPNTDVALMLGLAHTIMDRGLADTDFLDRCCVGYDVFAKELKGDLDGIVKDAAWASAITGVDEARILDLAMKIASRRSLITVTWSLQRQHHGEQTYWAAMSLAAMSGSMGLAGGGFGTGYSSMHNAHIWDRMSPAAALPQGRNPVNTYIPVARISDLLLNPGKPFDYDGKRSIYPDIRLVYWIGGNPFHHHQDLNKMKRAWAKPDTIIVHEPYWNAHAKHADIVMPVATSMERQDFAIGMGDNWLSWMDRVADPPEGITTDYEVFAAITKRLRAGDAFTEGRGPDEWVAELWERSIQKSKSLGFTLPPLDEFQRVGSLQLHMPRTSPTAFSELRKDPTKHPLATPSGKLEIFSETIAHFGYSDCPGWATWMEPAEWLGSSLAETFPLHLVSPQPDGKLHSQLDHGTESARHKTNGRTELKIGPDNARDRGLSDGDLVKVFNERGACLASVRIEETMLSNVVALPTGSWYDPVDPGEAESLEKHGNPNVLTLDIGTSKLAQGPSAHTCLVQVKRYEGEAPSVTAFEPPKFVPAHDITSIRDKGDTQ
ncbi:molybdopterin-dependent oxidoreductase [Paramicrobacterium fandaimingii]|uniref:molybdopterin-dependent oxidoreductase n=1 Tax=Paramicrobacterium fandaimingii TaxID=2708079 RepID=UPI0014209688|nr:molybdopterin-dependent oxidoreductase [Microbacterium fandaimingii]